jgi:hypothetical protein
LHLIPVEKCADCRFAGFRLQGVTPKNQYPRLAGTAIVDNLIILTEIEATFRSLKTDLGLRLAYHHKEDRVTGHLFLAILAYHLVHTLRHQLKEQGIHLSRDKEHL